MAKSEKRELGEKSRAGKMISEYIRALGSELTEVVLDDSPENPGPPRLVTKAEALARFVWSKALPSTKRSNDGTVETIEPNLDYVKMVFDRCDGKPGTGKDEDVGHESIPDKISRLSAKRLNGIADKIADD